MAKDLAYDSNGDLVLPPAFVHEQEEVEQTLLNLLLTPQGTSVDPNVGINFDWLLGGYESGRAVERITDALEQDERVTDVTNVSVRPSQSNPSLVVIDFTVQTTLGTIDTTKEVNINALNG